MGEDGKETHLGRVAGVWALTYFTGLEVVKTNLATYRMQKVAGFFNFPIWRADSVLFIVDAVPDCVRSMDNYPGSVFIGSQQEAKFLLAEDMHDLTAVTLY